MPLGVFALVRNEHQHPQLIMQLAINKQASCGAITQTK